MGSKEEKEGMEEIHRKITCNVPKMTIHNNRNSLSNSTVFLGHDHWDLVVYMMTGLQMATKSLISASYFNLRSRDYKIKYYFEMLPRYPLPPRLLPPIFWPIDDSERISDA